MNFGSLLGFHARTRGDAIAVRDNNSALTYSQLDDLAGKVAAILHKRGVEKGMPVAVISGNCLNQAVLYAGIMYAGAVFAPINFRLNSEEIANLLNLIGNPLTVADMDNMHHVRNGVELTSLIEEAGKSGEAVPCCFAEPSDPNNILFTSGTTGLPKGATLSHSNIVASAANCALLRGLDTTTVCYVPLPLYHTAALHGQLTSAWYCGGEAWILNSWDVDRVRSDMAKDHISSVFLMPEQWEDLMVHLPELRLHRMSDPRTAGARIKDELLDKLELLTGKLPNFGMGMTECSPHINFMSGGLIRTKNGTVGRPSAFADVIVCDDDNQIVPPGQVGEMRIRGPPVMSSYWNAPEATAESFDENGYFCGGDLVTQDEDGFIAIVDRKKDLIRSGGENVFCVEIEQTLLQHSGIQEVAVVGFPHEKWGEGVAAVIVPSDSGDVPALGDIQGWVCKHLASYKKPLLLEVRSELPRNKTGKVGSVRNSVSFL